MMNVRVIHVFLLVILTPTVMCALGGLLGIKQSAGVKGKLTCNGKPARDVYVKLYDDDRGLDMDDLMAEGYTDAQGNFELWGSNDEITPIDPKFNIYHDCNDGWWPCQRKISIMIPDGYITKGPKPEKIYDAKTMELAGKFPGETRDCFH